MEHVKGSINGNTLYIYHYFYKFDPLVGPFVISRCARPDLPPPVCRSTPSRPQPLCSALHLTEKDIPRYIIFLSVPQSEEMKEGWGLSTLGDKGGLGVTLERSGRGGTKGTAELIKISVIFLKCSTGWVV